MEPITVILMSTVSVLLLPVFFIIFLILLILYTDKLKKIDKEKTKKIDTERKEVKQIGYENSAFTKLVNHANGMIKESQFKKYSNILSKKDFKKLMKQNGEVENFLDFLKSLDKDEIFDFIKRTEPFLFSDFLEVILMKRNANIYFDMSVISSTLIKMSIVKVYDGEYYKSIDDSEDLDKILDTAFTSSCWNLALEAGVDISEVHDFIYTELYLDEESKNKIFDALGICDSLKNIYDQLCRINNNAY